MRIMFGLPFGAAADAADTLEAIGRSLAIIEFDPKGVVLGANETFCRAFGYTLAEIRGRHHSLFVDPADARSSEYQAFWAKLARGEFVAGEHKRLAKGGTEVWIQASYNPVLDGRGRVIKVVKVAAVITEEKLKNAENRGRMDAISRVQVIIEFTPAGEILDANDNFLNALGYRLDELRGRHHSMFVTREFAASADYQSFWRRLSTGEYLTGEFKRIGKEGQEVWIQASYNPIFDDEGRVVKVIKFATDVTSRVKAVEAVASGLSQLAANNLAYRIDQALDPAFEIVRADFNAAMTNLEATLVSVAAATDNVGGAAGEIATVADDLSQRSERQAASLEETAAALDEITATVKRSAAGATEAAAAVSGARGQADRSAEVVREAVAAMGEIETSSGQISQIIGVIDEIAFQTNLLALNAGVEAARAGEAGKGFAVVASEVRALAQRSAQAAKEIKALIAASTDQVERGVTLVEQTGHALHQIVDEISRINDLITEMAASAQEQATGLGEVNLAVNQMDQVTQQNAAMAEEANATAVNLRRDCAALRNLVGRFHLAGARSGAPAAAHDAVAPARSASLVAVAGRGPAAA